jgi:peptide subunit release factor 1 (eRF1)
MKPIMFYQNKLVVEVPIYYEHIFEYDEILILYYPNNKTFNIKFIVIGGNNGKEQNDFYNNMLDKKYSKIISEDKYYDISDHKEVALRVFISISSDVFAHTKCRRIYSTF